ncbi:helix-turn-helix transcriptional regulator [Nibribacter koreensis]|uniref:helix-turn-helix domain-containing protein n=1 Tax=Nibribacter koreensis TaxID=1084519 RepID=UPI0031E91702
MTDLLPRIKELLTWTGGGPAAFADAIGLSRPVMSHILAGRNKPSLEVVQKILARFPEVQAHWLLLGNGQMLTSLENSEQENFGQIVSPPEALSKMFADTAGESAKTMAAASEPKQDVQPVISGSQKKVKQVLLMYDDGTFESINSPD